VNAAEIKMSDEQGDSIFVILNLLAETHCDRPENI